MDGLNILNTIASARPETVLGLGFVEIIFKWGCVFVLVMYDLFAAVIIKQAAIMSETLDDGANGVVRMFAVVHLLASLLLTLAVILIV